MLVLASNLPARAEGSERTELQNKIDYLCNRCIDSINSPLYMTFYQEYVQFVDSTHDEDEMLRARIAYMQRWYMLGNTDSLVASLDRLKNFTLQYKRYDKFFAAWPYLISHYIMAGKYETAIHEAKLLCEAAIEYDYPQGLAVGETLIGDAYAYKGLYNWAVEYYEGAWDDFNKIPDANPDFVRDLFFSMNVANIKLKQYEKALAGCDVMDSITRNSNLRAGQNYPYFLVANCSRIIVFSRLGEYSKVPALIEEADSYYEECRSQIDYLWEAKAVYYEELGDYRRSYAYYDSIQHYYEELSLTEESYRYARLKSISLMKLGRFEDACKGLIYSIEGIDSVREEHAMSELNEMAVLNNLRQLEIKNKNLQIQNNRKNRVLFVVIAILLSFLCGLAVLLYFVERNMNEKLKKALRKAEESDRLKSMFLANMSHEIRTPLNAIVGFSHVLLDAEDEEEKKQYSHIIEINTDLLLNLINDILDMSRLESGSVELNISSFDLPKFMNDLKMNYRQLMKPGVSIDCICPDQSFEMVTDLRQLTQVMNNFVNNAIKFTAQGKITIGYERQNHGVLLYVQDTGKGIPLEKTNIIFERFQKLSEFTQGTGLGMAICKAISIALDGEIGVESELGVGSKFWIKLPYKKRHAD